MKKSVMISVAILAVMMVAGCGKANRLAASITGSAVEVCHRGVTYVQFTSGATVAVDRDGKPIPCGR